MQYALVSKKDNSVVMLLDSDTGDCLFADEFKLEKGEDPIPIKQGKDGSIYLDED